VIDNQGPRGIGKSQQESKKRKHGTPKVEIEKYKYCFFFTETKSAMKK